MTAITIITRSFHPDANVGVGGLGFEGDDRDFSFDKNVTARIHHIMPIIRPQAQKGAPKQRLGRSRGAALAR
ncbi:hypothetical protein [Tritonibacter scottomollicae]|uniref:hypothetical protein n=1 Tax=Tritonibacter scottomollicae TaxID=483013 RepID=UPI003AA9239E